MRTTSKTAGDAHGLQPILDAVAVHEVTVLGSEIGIFWTGTTCDDGWPSSTPSSMAGQRPVSSDPMTTTGCRVWPADRSGGFGMIERQKPCGAWPRCCTSWASRRCAASRPRVRFESSHSSCSATCATTRIRCPTMEGATSRSAHLQCLRGVGCQPTHRQAHVEVAADALGSAQRALAAVRVIDGQLRDDFARWYPGFPSNASTMSLAT